MNPILTGLLGLFCLLLAPVLIAITSTLLNDTIGLMVALLGLALIVASIIRGVRRSPR